LHGGSLLLVFYLFFFFLDQVTLVAVFAVFFLFFFIVIVVVIIFRDDIQVDGMYLRDFEFGFAFWAAQDFALLYFVFIDVNFCGTLWAANHDPSSVELVGRCEARIAGTHVERIIYRGWEVNCGGRELLR
jgi:hypothetical protein